jgi:hypothetical protein
MVVDFKRVNPFCVGFGQAKPLATFLQVGTAIPLPPSFRELGECRHCDKVLIVPMPVTIALPLDTFSLRAIWLASKLPGSSENVKTSDVLIEAL